jgi:hypothetical protein
MDDQLKKLWVEGPSEDFKPYNNKWDMVPKLYTLNAEQQAAFDWLVPFCLGEILDWKKVLLTGYAGTGKTFVLSRIIEMVRQLRPSINFGVTAPTHKAVRVLKKASEFADQLDFGTIHSFLGLKQKQNQETGEVTYEPDFNPNGLQRRIDGIHILIVDESSMLDDKLFGFIEDELRSNPRLRVIYVGDALQIPPVGKKLKVLNEVNAIPFIPERRKSHKIHLLELIQPQRQAADSPIIMYAHAIRNQILRQHIDFDFKEVFKDALEKMPATGSIPRQRELIEEFFLTDEFEKDTDYCKMIAWTNKTCRYLNNLVREMKYGTTEKLPMLLREDKLVMEEPIIVKNSVVIAKNDDVVLDSLETTDILYKYELITKEVFSGTNTYDPLSDITKHQKTVNFKVYKVRVRNEDGKSYVGHVIHEDSLSDYQNVLESIRQAALNNQGYDRSKMWKEFYRLPGDFIWMTHNYAITAHKSQGSTYQYTISHEWDIDSCKRIVSVEEANRIRYVSSTRASKKLFIIK